MENATDIVVGANVFIRRNVLQYANDVVLGHAHNFDHVTIVARGAVCIEVLKADGSPEYSIPKRAGEWALIVAGIRHRLMALENDTLTLCVYAHRDAQGNVLVYDDGWKNNIDPLAPGPAYE